MSASQVENLPGVSCDLTCYDRPRTKSFSQIVRARAIIVDHVVIPFQKDIGKMRANGSCSAIDEYFGALKSHCRGDRVKIAIYLKVIVHVVV